MEAGRRHRKLVHLREPDRSLARQKMDALIDHLSGLGWRVEDRRDLIAPGTEDSTDLPWYQR